MNLKPKESEIQSAILQYLTGRQHFVWKNASGAHRATYGGKDRFIKFGKKGSADILGVQRGTGRFIAIEVKAEGGRVRPEQREFLDRIRAEGGIAAVAYSVDDVIRAGL